MNGMITTKEYTDHSEVLKRIRNYSVEGVVLKTTTKEKYVLPGTGKKSGSHGFWSKEKYCPFLK